MASRFTDYASAARAAREMADRAGLEVAIRKVTELGEPGFNVSYASVNDSDYARAEIVRPERPGIVTPPSGSRIIAPPAAKRDARPLSCGFGQNLAKQMLESLLGNPHTVFYDPTPQAPGDYRYMKVRSQNADWWQELGDEGLDQKKLRLALIRASKCEPLNLKRKEDRWLQEATEKARRQGWHATFKGHPSPIGIDPEPPVKRRHFAPDQPHRIYLALPEEDYHRVLSRASAVHESPNLFLGHVIRDRLELDEWNENHPDEGVPF